ncbi:hypothetical protein CANARDRAFT_5885 [[Candida] arabinofermentans NRRL YB-2248]|uniref:Uncharacterized protein n=1 Tax=[Candida] arabinofermentans NRRL YB-2248 TaxID=983967 RepID=A0A1E4T6F5_9ASCO|nr:hypothetical protein CANARDRAFT_5885 [[Candida] arabinofermentans NRRL YB-2248]
MSRVHPKYYRFGFERSPNKNESNSQLLDQLKKTNNSQSKPLRITNEVKSLKALHFDNFISISDILQSSESGLDGVIVNSARAATSNGKRDVSEVKESLGDESNPTPDDSNADGIMIDIDSDLTHYLTLNNFHRIDPLDPVKSSLVVGVENLPVSILSSDRIIEHLLSYIVNEQIDKCTLVSRDEKCVFAEPLNKNFTWSFINRDYLGEAIVFVEFKDILSLYLFKRILDGKSIPDETEDKFDVEPQTDIQTGKEVKVVTKKIITKALDVIEQKLEVTLPEDEELNQKLIYLKQYVLKSDKGQGKLASTTSYYEEYEVDPSELAEIPPELVDTVRQDIIDFRLHVFKLEKQKKEQQQLNEKKNSRMKLKRIYNDLQHTDKKRKTVAIANDSDSEDEHEDDEEANNEMNDEEQERIFQAKEKARISSAYYPRLQQVRKEDLTRAKNVANFEKSIKHDVYVSEFVPSQRRKFLDNFVNNITDSNNKIDANLDYYKKNSNYLAFREKVKLAEERSDDLDRQAQEQLEIEAASEKSKFMASFETKDKPLKISLKKRT